VLPAHLFLGFLAMLLLWDRPSRKAALATLQFPKPGFWLACLGVYGVMTAWLFPRVLMGVTQIVPLGASQYLPSLSPVPLGPVSSNLTQSIYLIGDVVCYALIASHCATSRGYSVLLRGVYALIIADVIFAALDVGTYATGTTSWLAWLRNAHYQMHESEAEAGLKRIVGSFVEASAFADMTLGAFAFTATMLLLGYRRILFGVGSFVLASLIILSTSSTGVVGLAVVAVVLCFTALWLLPRQVGLASSMTLVLLPLVVGVVSLTLMVNEQSSETVMRYVNATIIDKAHSDSAIQRSMWNAVGMQNFMDTYGLGVGYGTIRTSNLVVALLGNIGVVGTILYCLFVYASLLRPWGRGGNFNDDVRWALANGCFGFMAGGMLAAPTVDPGLLFMIFTGAAAARQPPAIAECPTVSTRASAPVAVAR
jgi:putative effector of murein hydrolase LrgA (UPF0299 family)